MKALLWKDLYINRVVLVAMVIALIFPYAAGIARNLQLTMAQRDIDMMLSRGELPEHPVSSPTPWATLFLDLGIYSLVLSGLTLAALAGNVLAGEHSDRSAEFLRALPIANWRILSSKIGVVVTVALFVWAIDLAVIYEIAPRAGFLEDWQSGSADAVRVTVIPNVAAATVLALGIAWFCGSLLASPAIASVTGIAAPLVLFVALGVRGELAGGTMIDVQYWFRVLGVALGLLGLGGGAVCVLRRVEP